MTDMTTVELYVMVNESGDYSVHTEEGDLGDHFDTEHGGYEARRTFKLVLQMPLPKVTTVAATIPDTDGPVTVTVAA